MEFDRKNLKKWVKRMEIRLEFCQVKSQWLKRVCLENMLPADLCECMNDLLQKDKSEAGATIYKECKERLLKVHGPKPEEEFTKAMSMVLTGLPSDALKQLQEMVCQKPHKLTECCGVVAVSKFWRDMLPREVKSAVANLDLSTEAGFQAACTTADAVWRSLSTAGQGVTPVAPVQYTSPPPNTPIAAVTAAVSGAAAALAAVPADLDTSADAPAFQAVNQLVGQLAAINKRFNPRGQGQKGRGYGAKGRGGQQQRETPPPNACNNHKRFGKRAWSCSNQDQCPWKNYLTTPPPKSGQQS